MTPEQSLDLNFREVLELPQDAIDWLLGLWRAIQALDDLADGDAVEPTAVHQVAWDLFAGMPGNPFFTRYQAWLVPACAQAVIKWVASDVAERSGQADARSFMWRAGYYDVVCLAVSLVHGPDEGKTRAALALYGESCAEYLREFGDA